MSARTTEFAAKLTGDANSVLAAMERTKAAVKDTAAASEQANAKLDASTATFIKNSEKAARGIAAVTQAMYALGAEGSARVLAVGGAVGNFADLMGPGGKVVSGIAIVTSSIIALFMQAKEKSREAAQAIEQDIRRMASASDLAGLDKRRVQLQSGDRLFDDPNEKNNADAKARADAIRAGGLSALEKQIASLQAEVRKLPPALDEGGAAIEAFNKKRADAQKKLDTLIPLERRLRTEYTLTSTELKRVVAQDVDRTTIGIKLAAQEEAARKAAAELARLKSTLAEISKDVDKTIRDALLKDDERRQNAVAALTAEEAARERNNTQLAEQVSALLKSKEAYEQVLVTQAGANAVFDAEAKATAARIVLSDKERAAIRATAEENAKLERLKRGLLGMGQPEATGAKQQTIEAGKYAEALSLAAGAAAGIATGFGEAGRNAAALLGTTSQLLTAMSRAQSAGIFTTKDGKGKDVQQNVGFLGALTGKAGVGGTATAIGSSLSIVAAGVQLASALDLFGNKAREQARLLRERAKAFNTALDDFAISSRTELEDRLRQNVASANQVANAAGLDATFRTVADIFAKIGELRETARTANSGKEARASGALLLLADQLEQLGRVATENEAKLKAANDSAILRLREDLDVRRLALSAGSEAADQKRAELEILRQEQEIRDRYGDAADAYIADLVQITAAENALAAATKRRAAALQQVEDDNAVLGGSGTERLQRRVQAFGETFFSGLFDGLDLSSRDGLEAAKAKAREFYQQLAADGISESERPLVDWIRSIIGDIDGAISELPGVLDPIATQLEAFNDRVRLLGTGAQQQLVELAGIFRGKFGDWFDAMLGTVDLGNADSRSAFRQTIEDQINAILSDGVISEGERALYEALQLFLGVVTSAIDQAAAEAAQAAQDALATRQANRTGAQNQIQLFGLTGLDALRVQLDALGTAFAGLFAQFDLTTLAGLEAAQGALQSIFTDLSAMTDEEILAKFGMTRDEVVAALLDTNSGLNGLKSSLNDVAQSALNAANAAKEFSDQIADDYLRSQGRNEEADRAAALRKRDDRLKQAAQLGLGPEIIAQIESIYQADLLAIAARYAPKATDAFALAGSGVASGAGLSSNAPATSEAARPKTRNTTLVQDFGGLSELTAQSMAGLLRAIEINTGDAGAIVRALTRLPTMPLSSLQFPTYSAASAGGGSTFVFSGTINVQVGAVASTGASLDEVGYETARAVSKHLGRMARAGVMYLGDGRA